MRWALVSPDGAAPSRMVDVSASVNLPLHHKVQKFFSGRNFWNVEEESVHMRVILSVNRMHLLTVQAIDQAH